MPLSYTDCIAHHAARCPAALAAVDLESGRRLTYDAFDRRIAALAGHLKDVCGIGLGARVGVLAHNSTDIFELQFACFRLGAIFVPLNWRLTLPELDAILADCTPSLLVYDAEFADTAGELVGRHGTTHGLLRESAGGDYERAIATACPLATPQALVHDDTCTILYTSGTTGVAKGVIITHGMNFWNAANCIGVAGLSTNTVLLGILPLFHAAGLNIYANPTFHAGGTVAIMRRFDSRTALRLLADGALGVTHLHCVPAHYEAMAAHPDFAAADLSHLVGTFVGGASVPLALLEIWSRRGVVLR